MQAFRPWIVVAAATLALASCDQAQEQSRDQALDVAPPPSPADASISTQDFNAVVSRCAGAPEDTACTERWVAYLERNYRDGTDIEALLKQLLTRIDQRIATGHDSTGRLSLTGPEKQALRSRLMLAALDTIRTTSKE